MSSQRFQLRGCLGIAACWAFAGSHTPAAEIRTVALTGQQAPGADVGVLFNALTTSTRLNNEGQAAFEATLTGTGVTAANDSGVWSESSGSLALLAREGGQAAGLPAGVLYDAAPFRTVLNDQGRGVIMSALTVSGVPDPNDRAIWSVAPGGHTLVARRGLQAPGTPSGVTLSIIAFTPRANDAGQIIFTSAVAGADVNDSNNSGIWLSDAGAISLVAREGSQAPGTPAGVNFGAVGTTMLNSAGQTAFTASVTGAGVNATNNLGIWRGGPGSVALKVRAGNAAPGGGAGVNFADFSFFPSLNGAGRIAFKGSVSGSSVSTVNDIGIWSEGGGSLSLVARKGSPAAGVGTGVNYADLFDPVINAKGETAFRATVAGAGISAANDTAIWSGLPGSLDLIAREGTQAPGTPEGVTFAVFDAPVLNAAGQIAFVGGLTGAGVTTANDRGIWATDVFGQLQLIAREGNPIEVEPGVMRTVNALATLISAGDDGGGPTGFNDRGQLAFTTSFTDGTSGAFVSSLVERHGDFNGDGSVDGNDLALWRDDFGEAGANLDADDDDDGDVDGVDFLAWQRGLSAPGAPTQPVPEPASGLLAAVAFAIRRCFDRRGLPTWS